MGAPCHACGGSGRFLDEGEAVDESCDYCEGTGVEMPDQTETRTLTDGIKYMRGAVEWMQRECDHIDEDHGRGTAKWARCLADKLDAFADYLCHRSPPPTPKPDTNRSDER